MPERDPSTGRFKPVLPRSSQLFTIARPGYQHAKGGCYVYGSTDEGVDMGVDIVGEGALFLSKQAILEAAGVAGFDFTENVAQLEEENAYLTRERDEWRQKYADLREGLSAARKALNDGPQS